MTAEYPRTIGNAQSHCEDCDSKRSGEYRLREDGKREWECGDCGFTVEMSWGPGDV